MSVFRFLKDMRDKRTRDKEERRAQHRESVKLMPSRYWDGIYLPIIEDFIRCDDIRTIRVFENDGNTAEVVIKLKNDDCLTIPAKSIRDANTIRDNIVTAAFSPPPKVIDGSYL
mgnify:CR=1 FL=1